MPFAELTTEAFHAARRVLIAGAPNTLKTTSLLSWPRPSIVLSAPGEKGWETLRGAGEGLTAKVFQMSEMEKASPSLIVKELEAETWKALGTPGLKTFALDGLHKIYPWYYKIARARLAGASLAGKNASEEEHEKARDLAAYGNAMSGAYADVSLYLARILASPVPYVVMTCWIEPEPDENRSASMHDYPALPGKLAKHIVGEFGACLASEVSLPDLKGQVKGTWQIRKEGKIWGVGVKINPDLAKKLPSKIEQDFGRLEKLLTGEGV